MLGDIFDLWVSDAPIFIRKFQAIVDAIAEIKRMGIKIVYFEGNHDLHVGKFWQEQMGISTFTEYKVFDLGKYNIRLEHGDLVNYHDKAYLRYRSVVRHPIVETLAPIIAGKTLNEIGQLASQISRKFSSPQRQRDQEGLRKMIRKHAKIAYQETPFDLIVTGHMHVQDDFEFEIDGHKTRSINLGSWFDGPKALKVKITPENLQAEFVALD